MSSQYEQLLRQAEQQYGLPAGILDYLVQQESGGNPTAVSPKGAGGIMQIMPDTASYLGISEKDRFDPAKAIPAGAKYLGQQLQKFGSLPLALAAYNAGPRAVVAYGNNIPPYPETQQYVDNIMGRYKQQQPQQAPQAPAPQAPPVVQQPPPPQPVPPGNWKPQELPQQGRMPVRNPMVQTIGDKLGMPEGVTDQLANTSGGHWQGMAEYGMGAGLGAAKPEKPQDAFDVMPTLISILLNPNLGGQRSRKRVI